MHVTDATAPKSLNAVAEAKTGARFFIVSVAAFLADLIIVMTIREVFGLSVTASAAIGFVTAWIGSYLGHEYWTFRGAGSGASMGRLTKNLISNAIALSVRLAIIFTLETIHAPETRILAFAYFFTGAGSSFTVNFLINRFWVFARK